MSKPSWKAVSARLKAGDTRNAPPAADNFWPDFKARAKMVRQEEPAGARERIPAALRWGGATVLALVLVAAGLFILPAPSGAVTRIKALEVVAPHSGVIIMNDQSGRGTILWITGMESKHSSG